jgi:hypothetical protein
VLLINTMHNRVVRATSNMDRYVTYLEKYQSGGCGPCTKGVLIFPFHHWFNSRYGHISLQKLVICTRVLFNLSSPSCFKPKM